MLTQCPPGPYHHALPRALRRAASQSAAAAQPARLPDADRRQWQLRVGAANWTRIAADGERVGISRREVPLRERTERLVNSLAVDAC